MIPPFATHRTLGIILGVVITFDCSTGWSAGAVPLVNINFDDETPGQPPGLYSNTPPATLPGDRLVDMNFGQAVVVDDVPGMSQPARLMSGGGYTQPVVFSNSLTPIVGSRLSFEMDFRLSDFQKRSPVLARSVDEFTVFFDVPQAVRMDFTTDGRVGRVSIGGGTPNYVGTFAFDAIHHLHILVNLEVATWSASLNGAPLFANAAMTFALPGSALQTLRLNLEDDGTLPNAPIAHIDNLRLTDITNVPEPGSTMLFVGGAGLLFVLRRCAKASGSNRPNKSIAAAGVPPGFPNPQSLITGDCIQPTHDIAT